MNIVLKGIQTKAPLAMAIRPGTKSIRFLTYTLSAEAIEELNQYHVKGIKIHGVAAKTDGDFTKACFNLIIDKKCHAKLWIRNGKEVYIGSSNVTRDTLFNIMLKVRDKKQAAMLHDLFWSAYNQELCAKTIVI